MSDRPEPPADWHILGEEDNELTVARVDDGGHLELFRAYLPREGWSGVGAWRGWQDVGITLNDREVAALARLIGTWGMP